MDVPPAIANAITDAVTGTVYDEQAPSGDTTGWVSSGSNDTSWSNSSLDDNPADDSRYYTYTIFEDDGNPAWVDYVAPLDAEEEVMAIQGLEEESERQRRQRWLDSQIFICDGGRLPAKERLMCYYRCEKLFDGRSMSRGQLLNELEIYLRIWKYININLRKIYVYGCEALQVPDPDLAFVSSADVCDSVSTTTTDDMSKAQLLVASQASTIFDPTSADFDGLTLRDQTEIECARDSFISTHIGIVENLKLVYGVTSLDYRFLELRNARNRYGHDWKTPKCEGNVALWGSPKVSVEGLEGSYKALLPSIKHKATEYAAALRDPLIWSEPEMPADYGKGEEQVPTDWCQVAVSDHGDVQSEHSGWPDSSNEDEDEDEYQSPEPLQLSRRTRRKVRLHSKTVLVTSTKLHPILLKAIPRSRSVKQRSCRSRDGHKMKSHRAKFKLHQGLMGPHELSAGLWDVTEPSMESDKDYMSTIIALYQFKKTAPCGTNPIVIRGDKATTVGGPGYRRARNDDWIGGKIWDWMKTGPWTRQALRASLKADLDAEVSVCGSEESP